MQIIFRRLTSSASIFAPYISSARNTSAFPTEQATISGVAPFGYGMEFININGELYTLERCITFFSSRDTPKLWRASMQSTWSFSAASHNALAAGIS